MKNFEPLDVLAARVAQALRARGQTVAVVESSAGGLVSAALLAIPGASAYFVGGAVIYSRKAGRGLLGLTAEDMVGLRAETEAYASMVAGKIRDKLGASWGLCESGAAGPTGSVYGDAAGHVCVAVAGPGPAAGTAAVARALTLETASTDRPANMDVFARQLLTLFDAMLQG